MTKVNVFVGSDQELEVLREGCRRRPYVRSAELQLDEIQYDAGEGSGAGFHAHGITQASYVVSGEFEVTVGDQTRILKPGDTFLALAGTPHAVKCLQTGSYIQIKSLGGNDKILSSAPHDDDHDHAGHSDHAH